MKTTLACVFAIILCGPALAVGDDVPMSPLVAWQADRTVVLDAADIDLPEFQWIARPVVVFADSPADPRLVKQLDLLAARVGELVERDIVVIVDSDPAAESALRTELRPRGFMLVLIDKDGGVKLRKAAPWHVRELTRIIDKTPERQQEVRDRRALAE
jgi:hypothetical protein